MAAAVGLNAVASGAQNEMRLIILGRTGTGKSSFANTIIGCEELFTTDISQNSITTQCASAARVFDRKRLFVVDTPGFLDPNVTQADIQKEVAKSYEMTARPGPHAFLLVLEPGRFTDQEAEAIDYLTKIFGPKAVNHAIIVFTHGDRFKKSKTIHQFVDESKDMRFKTLLDQCGRRYLSVNNEGTEADKDATIRALIDMIEKMISDNGGQVFTSDAFKKVAEAIAIAESEGTFKPYNPDGSYALHPKTKEIVIDGYLRRTIGRRAI